jgi:hypothetical protein
MKKEREMIDDLIEKFEVEFKKKYDWYENMLDNEKHCAICTHYTDELTDDEKNYIDIFEEKKIGKCKKASDLAIMETGPDGLDGVFVPSHGHCNLYGPK